MRTYISLFSGAGVGCYGFKDSFECVATNELLEERLDVQRANGKCRYESGYICGDITSEDVRRRLADQIELWREAEGMERVDVVFATPPCQGMSTANYKKSADEQKRNSLVVEAIRIIREIEPRIFIFENVRAFMKTVCTDLSGEDMTIRESIFRNLSARYRIYHKVINFKDYGVPSSRPRTIVIGTHRSLRNIAPLNLFPTRRAEITLREAIGGLPRLGYGEKDAADFLHSARRFPEYQLPWIETLKEGESAFDNPPGRRPYKLNAAGERVGLKGAYMGNKYRRLRWDRPCSCVATRNDQLASQDTIHPTDNRVLSIRELMRVMTVPDTFRWSAEDEHVSPQNSDAYLKEHELNIRRCIGEAVPTHIIGDIARKAAGMLDFQDFADGFDPGRIDEYAADRDLAGNFYIDTFIKEQRIADAKRTGAFYTPQCVVYDCIEHVSIPGDEIRILEPAAGLGAFLPQLAAMFSDAGRVVIDAVDISPDTIAALRESLEKIDLGENVRVEFICGDFLKLHFDRRYDLVATNPPYASVRNGCGALPGGEHKTRNLFALFLIKLYGMADDIACVIPKNFIMADEFSSVRRMYENYPIAAVCDFGVKYFKKVFIEIITLHFSKRYDGPVLVTDCVNELSYRHAQGYMFHDRVWLIYRDEFFDRYIRRLRLDAFTAFRDRQITNRHLKKSGRIWVLRSKNILDDGSIVHKPGYDRFIDSAEGFAVGKYLGSRAVIMPNFTYNTRASILPDDTVPNGSIAILTPKPGVGGIDLSLYATDDFRRYYAIVKSRSRFTLNIDRNSLYYIGTIPPATP